jgi:hypothetical protein
VHVWGMLWVRSACTRMIRQHATRARMRAHTPRGLGARRASNSSGEANQHWQAHRVLKHKAAAVQHRTTRCSIRCNVLQHVRTCSSICRPLWWAFSSSAIAVAIHAESVTCAGKGAALNHGCQHWSQQRRHAAHLQRKASVRLCPQVGRGKAHEAVLVDYDGAKARKLLRSAEGDCAISASQ